VKIALLGDTMPLEMMVKGANLRSSRTAGLLGFLAQLAQIMLKVTILMAAAAVPYLMRLKWGVLLPCLSHWLCMALVLKGCSTMERTAR
jgi:hypothetical protein